MKKFYLILPVVLLALFMVVYLGHREEMIEDERRDKEAAEQVAAAENEKKLAAELRARNDAEERTRKREEEEKKKEDDKRAKYEADLGKLVQDASTANSIADRLAKESADLELKLVELRKKRAAENSLLLELAKGVELARIEKRNAELEIQRTTEMLSRRASESSLAVTPVLPLEKSS